MSVQVNTYVMYGALLPYTEDPDDKFDPYRDSAYKGIHHHLGLCVLQDGMNGEYTAIGKVLAKSEESQGLESPVMLIGPSPDEASELKRAISELVPDAEFEVLPIVLSHYR